MPGEAFTQMARYRGEIVGVKIIDIPVLAVTKELITEITEVCSPCNSKLHVNFLLHRLCKKKPTTFIRVGSY